MGKTSTRRQSVKVGITPGKRVGTKKSDNRWQTPDGEVWDSRYECIVYQKFKDAGFNIERCDESDTVSFALSIRGASCETCGSTDVGQRRTFTPDFRIVSSDPEHPSVLYYIETKGYIRAKERSLLRAFSKAHPDLDCRYILQYDYRVSKRGPEADRGIVNWFKKFMKGKITCVWSGTIPEWPSGTGSTATGLSTPKRSTSTTDVRKSRKRS